MNPYRKIKISESLLILVLCFGVNILSFLCPITMRIVTDNLGALTGAARLAGYAWEAFESVSPYYGQGYYILFAPLFMLTDNPFIIWGTIIIVNAVVRALGGCMAYTISYKYLNLGRGISVGMALLSQMFIAANSILRPNNETPLFLVVWLCALCVVRLLAAREKRTQIIRTLVLVAVLSYGLLIHTRVLLLFICTLGGLLVFSVLYKKALLHVPTAVVSGVIGYLATKAVKGYIVGLKGVANLAESHNATLELERYTQNAVWGIKEAVLLVFSNLYRLMISTYGLAAMGILAAIIILCALLFKRGDSEKHQDTPDCVLVAIYGVCVLGTITGLVMYYGNAFTTFWEDGTAGRFLSSLYYDRYWIVYTGPFLLGAAAYFVKHSGLLLKYVWIPVLGIAALFAYMFYVAFPRNQEIVANFCIVDIQANGNGKWDALLSAAILILFLVLSAVLFLKNREKYVIFAVVLIFCLNTAKTIERPFFDLRLDDNVDGTYEMLSRCREQGVTIDRLSASAYYLCFVFPRYDIVKFDVDNLDEEIIILNEADQAAYAEQLSDAGYQMIQLDENEFLWTGSQEMYSQIYDIHTESEKMK